MPIEQAYLDMVRPSLGHVDLTNYDLTPPWMYDDNDDNSIYWLLSQLISLGRFCAAANAVAAADAADAIVAAVRRRIDELQIEASRSRRVQPRARWPKHTAKLESDPSNHLSPIFGNTESSLVLDAAHRVEDKSKGVLNTKPRLKTVYDVTGLINGIEASAIPDTGSSINVINTDIARRYGLKINKQPRHRTRIKVLGGGESLSDGIVKVKWTFANEPGVKYKLVFHAVPSCPCDFLLGRPFLAGSETMGRNRHRIIARQMPVDGCRRVFFQDVSDSPVQCVRGELDDVAALAVVDSGCEPNIISLAHAQERGYKIDDSPGTKETLLFANGTEQQTVGKVQLTWKFQDSGEEHHLIFDVLDGCQFDVILGQDIIFSSQLFSEHTSSLLELQFTAIDATASTQEHLQQQYKVQFRLVNFVRKIPAWFLRRRSSANDEGSHSVHPQALLERDAEFERRARAERIIADMPQGEEKDAAAEVERETRDRWHEGQRQRTAESETDSSGAGTE